MSYLYDMRSGELVKSKLYSNGLNIPNVLIKKPLLEADFTTGTYKASGATKTFADLFTFTRAGKAWLVKDTGLQEYVADVPRLDNGLLIEQAATNYHSPSYGMVIGNGVGLVFEDFVAPDNNTYKQKIKTWGSTSNRYEYPVSYANLVGKDVAMSYHASKASTPPPKLNNTSNTNTSYASNISTIQIIQEGGVVVHRDSITLRSTVDASDVRWRFYVIDSNNSGALFLGVGFWGWQVEDGKTSSYIPTTSSPVTRPADYLLNNITGTTVTGDWDSTLTLSIVAGKLVHSGYGRIRSLEID